MLTAEETKILDKKHLVHSWSVQEKLDPMIVEKSEGLYFWDVEGNRYLDFSSALVNMNVGHQHPKVISAIKAQADKLCYLHPGKTCSSRAELAGRLAQKTPGDLNKFFLTLGGAPGRTPEDKKYLPSTAPIMAPRMARSAFPAMPGGFRWNPEFPV
jgi:taurine--2-oxoglutarate transaminase